MMTLDGEEGRKDPIGVYHLKPRAEGVPARTAAAKVVRAQRRRAFKQLSRKMSHRQLKKDGLYDFTLNGCHYKDFLPMHTLWLQYMSALIGKMGTTPSLEQLGTKMLKADWHGAFVTVVSSETPSLIGHCGIVLVERKNTFLIVNKKSELLLLVKRGSVFAMQINGLIVKLFGDALRVRSAERSVQKFRQKH